MSAAHTPTPWRVNGTLIEAANGRVVCDVENLAAFQPESAEDQANAAFIVLVCNAHPDLLEALQKLSNGWEYSTEVIEIAKAALAKAGV